MPRCLLLTIVLLLSTISTAQSTPEKTVTIRATIAKSEWKGWGRYSEPNPHLPDALPIKEQLTVTHVAKDQPRSFEGKVAGLGTYEGAEVGLVSIEGVWWMNNKCYEWAAVKPDGSFLITAKNYPDSVKALCIRAPGHSWTFLRYNFKAGEGGSGIVLHAQPGKRVRISASVGDDPLPCPWLSVDPFEAYRSFDDHDEPLAKQRYGHISTQDHDLYLTLPLGKVALFMRASDAAHHYAIIDTTEADHFHFTLLRAARLVLSLERDGKPAANMKTSLWNGAAPLSELDPTTDADGKLDWGGLVPGTYSLEVGRVRFDIPLREGETVTARADLTTGKWAPIP